MKGSVAVRTVVLLVIAVIVIAVALYFLVFVVNFDSLFLSNDQRILKQYATCALAYCASGAGSDEVNAVGCLKSEGGKCVLSCAQVEKELYFKNGVPSYDYFGTKFYCGKDAALDFEFSGISLGGTVPLKSGQMEKLTTKPQWICKPLKFPLTGIYVDQFTLPFKDVNTAEIQYHGSVVLPWIKIPQNCIMLDKFDGLSPPSDWFAPEGFKSGGGCFASIYYNKEAGRDSLYTPLLAYESNQQKTYPSGIYLKISEGFTTPLSGFENPECTLREPIKKYNEISAEELKGKIDLELADKIAKFEGVKFLTKDVCEDCVPQIAVTEEEKNVGKSYDQLTDPQKLRIAYQIMKITLGSSKSSSGSKVDEGKSGYSIDSCNFKTTYKGKKIKYSVWADPAFPSDDFIQKPLEGIGGLILSVKDAAVAQATSFRGFFSIIFGSPPQAEPPKTEENKEKEPSKSFLEQFGSKAFGSCSSVTLSRILEGPPITTQDIFKEATTYQFSNPEAVSGISTPNSETSPFALVDGQKIYLFFERTTGDAFKPLDASSKEIWYTVSEDGGSTWQEAKGITDYSTGVSALEPSAAVFNGEIYVAYKERTGQRRENAKYNVVVRSLDGAYEKKFADVATNDRGGPSLVIFGNSLYLFYHQRAGPLAGGDFYKIYYTTWDGNAEHDWQSPTLVPTPKIDGASNFLNSPNAWSMYPNALATSNGIILSYSYSAQTGQIGSFHEAFDVRAVRFDGKGTSEDLGEISADESGTDIPNRRQGFSHLVEKNGEIFVFYDEDDIARGGKTVDPTEAEFKSHINYKKYNPDSGWDVFPTSLFETKSKALQPTPVSVGDKILLFLSSNEGSNRWDILSSVGEKKIVLTEVPSGPDVVQGISGKTDKDSYKKGETIKFAGSLTMASGKPEGKEVRIILKFGPAELLNQDAAVAADGSFVWEYALPAGVAIGTYEIVASSGGREVSYKFAVTD